jgi:hypothetical protein
MQGRVRNQWTAEARPADPSGLPAVNNGKALLAYADRGSR